MSLNVVLKSSRDVTANIDGDIVAFRAAYIGRDGYNAGLACSVAKEMMDTILTNTEASNHHVFFTGENNYRKSLLPDYKANRKDKPKPEYIEDVMRFMESRYNCTTVDTLEADDLLGVYQHDDTILCTVDKDLLQIRGLHYNITTEVLSRVTDVEADRKLLSQVLTGDSTDNIFGLKGIGPKKAERWLDENISPLMGLYESLQKIKDYYQELGYSDEQFYNCLNGVYIQREYFWYSQGIIQLFGDSGTGKIIDYLEDIEGPF